MESHTNGGANRLRLQHAVHQLTVRAWNAREKQMIYLTDNREFRLFGDGLWEIASGQGDAYRQYAASGEDELMRGISMLDKHNREIYTEDLIWQGEFDTRTGKKILYVVDFQHYGYVLVPARVWTDLEYCGGGFTRVEYSFPVVYEIVGNCHENADLLENAA